MLVSCTDLHILPSPTPGPSTCLPNYYRCSSGACVMDSWVCDGYRDCADGSDEEACPSPGECGACLQGADLWGVRPGYWVSPAFWAPVLCWPGCCSPPERGHPWLWELEGLTSSNRLVILLHGKASRPASRPGCGGPLCFLLGGITVGATRGVFACLSDSQPPCWPLAAVLRKEGEHCHLVAERRGTRSAARRPVGGRRGGPCAPGSCVALAAAQHG